MAIRNYSGAARHIEPKRAAGERDHAVIESNGIAQPADSGVARGGHSVHAAQIVGSLVPGAQPEEKTAAAKILAATRRLATRWVSRNGGLQEIQLGEHAWPRVVETRPPYPVCRSDRPGAPAHPCCGPQHPRSPPAGRWYLANPKGKWRRPPPDLQWWPWTTGCMC